MDSSFSFLVAGLPERVRYLEEKGLFNDAIHLVNKILAENNRLPTLLKSRLEWETERIERIKKDYTLSQEEAFESLKNPVPDLNRKDFEGWMKEGLIEYREIEGKTKIFKNFLPNLLRDSEEVKESACARNQTKHPRKSRNSSTNTLTPLLRREKLLKADT